ncbi:MAG TPA: hypothetical protein VGE07_18285 [Herpetosiphonaceae bacterium]
MTFTITSQNTPFGFAMFASRPHPSGTIAVLLDEPNPRAALYAAKKSGVTRVIEAVTAASVDRLLESGDVLIPDQLADLTQGRPSTFFANRGYGFIAQHDVWCPATREALLAGAREINQRAFGRGTLAVVDEGADLSAAPGWGAHAAAVTGAPAAYLAKELELCYAVVVIVGAAASEQGNAIIAAMLKHLPPERACACGQTMAAARERGLVGEDWQTWIGDHTHGD